MNINRAGHARPIRFGTCSTAQAVLRYAEIEGFPIGKAYCKACGYKWTMIVCPPQDFDHFRKRCVHNQPCPKCDTLSVGVRSLKQK